MSKDDNDPKDKDRDETRNPKPIVSDEDVLVVTTDTQPDIKVARNKIWHLRRR